MTKPRRLSLNGADSAGSKWVADNLESILLAKKENDGQIPCSIALVTTSYPHKDVWSIDRLPSILFYLVPPQSEYHGVAVGQKTREDGKVLRDLPVLPDRISVLVDGWLIEAWRRIDDRIGYDDIVNRMTADPDFCNGRGLHVPMPNALQMHALRSCRKLLRHWTTSSKRQMPPRTAVEAIEALTFHQIRYNTILPQCRTDPNRLVRLKLHRPSEGMQYQAVEVQTAPETLQEDTFPIDFFCEHLVGGCGEMSDSMNEALELLLILQERATLHSIRHWSKLSPLCRPATWLVTRKRSGQRYISNEEGDMFVRSDSSDGGCGLCSWIEERDYGLPYELPDDVPIFVPPTRRGHNAFKVPPQNNKRGDCSNLKRSDNEDVSAEDNEIKSSIKIEPLTKRRKLLQSRPTSKKKPSEEEALLSQHDILPSAIGESAWRPSYLSEGDEMSYGSIAHHFTDGAAIGPSASIVQTSSAFEAAQLYGSGLLTAPLQEWRLDNCLLEEEYLNHHFSRGSHTLQTFSTVDSISQPASKPLGIAQRCSLRLQHVVFETDPQLSLHADPFGGGVFHNSQPLAPAIEEPGSVNACTAPGNILNLPGFAANPHDANTHSQNYTTANPPITPLLLPSETSSTTSPLTDGAETLSLTPISAWDDEFKASVLHGDEETIRASDLRLRSDYDGRSLRTNNHANAMHVKLEPGEMFPLILDHDDDQLGFGDPLTSLLHHDFKTQIN